MVFSSIIFLFAFLPGVLVVYHLIFLPAWFGSTAKRWRTLANLFLLTVSLLFYFWGEKFLVWVFVATVFIDYFCALLISGALLTRHVKRLQRGVPRSGFQKAALVASVCSNLAILGYFKYFNFGVDTFNSFAARFGFKAAAWENAPKVLLPLGISFFVFHSMSYTIDVYRGYVTATRNLIDYASYVLMFPQLVAGPIVRYSLVAKQLVLRRMNMGIFASGISRFLAGLTKKVLISNTVSIFADRMFTLPAADLHLGVTWLGVLAYTLQIYFDFSGYSDMAIGLGRMLGFELPINFDYPYTATSIRDFWRRWHISLSTWFQDYLYIPLGGSRKRPSRTYANLVTVFFLCGLWHGAKWTFVAWGFYHGLFLVLERSGFERLLSRVGVFRHAYTLVVVMVGWVLFRADTFTQALNILRGMAGLNPGASEYPIQWFATPDIILALVVGVIFCAPVVPALQRRLEAVVSQAEGTRRSIYIFAFSGLRLTCACLAMLLCAAGLASGTHNPFIYFRF
jgi:alginate O-acetyltransferase complex protein AlgI